jgi:class 3 adenylate cyclase
VAGLSRSDVAARAGVSAEQVDRIIACGLLSATGDGDLNEADVRRVTVVTRLEQGGLEPEAIAAGVRRGLLSLDFVDAPEYQRFGGVASETFEAVSARTGVPLALLQLLREASGFTPPQPGDHPTLLEMQVVPFLELEVRYGFRPVAIERHLRAISDNMRKLAEAEAEWWRSEVSGPRMEAGADFNAVAAPDISEAIDSAYEQAMIAIWHAQQAQTWSANILSGFEQVLAQAGIQQRADRVPAICFLDITGYTRLTQERGDLAAAELVETLNRLVKRSSVEHGGRPVKWLGDGVMFWFREPGPAVVAALEMVRAIPAAGLPPAHVGLHTGPVIIQEGDYYGATVNMAARIAEYARPGEVLVSDAVVDASAERAASLGLSFAEIGPVDLKGVSGGVVLHAARKATA